MCMVYPLSQVMNGDFIALPAIEVPISEGIGSLVFEKRVQEKK